MLVRTKHRPPTSVLGLIQALQIGQIDFGEETVLNSHLIGVDVVRSLVGTSSTVTVIVAVRHP